MATNLTKKAADGDFLKIEDAKTGLLVSFSDFPRFTCLASGFPCQNPNLFLYQATWHSTVDSFRVPQSVPAAPLIRSRFSSLFQVPPFASTAANTGEGSDRHSQRGCQQANWPALRLSHQDQIYSCQQETQLLFVQQIGDKN